MKIRCVVLALLILLLFSCSHGNSTVQTNPYSLFAENPATINWKRTEGKEIETFSADVVVYTMNSKKDTSLSVSEKYRLTTRSVDGALQKRIDIPKEYNGGQSRMYLMDDSQFIIANSQTEEVELRLPMEQETANPDLAVFSTDTVFGRVNLKLITETAQRLAFDITEESNEILSINLPSKYFSDETTERISTKLCFDISEETLQEVELVEVDSEGNRITTTVYPMYETIKGEPVKIGQITIIDTQKAELLEGFDDVEYFDSMDEIPILSDEEYEQLMADGVLFEEEYLEFGNPADLSNVETIVEVYETIDINKAEESMFRLLQESF